MSFREGLQADLLVLTNSKRELSKKVEAEKELNRAAYSKQEAIKRALKYDAQSKVIWIPPSKPSLGTLVDASPSIQFDRDPRNKGLLDLRCMEPTHTRRPSDRVWKGHYVIGSEFSYPEHIILSDDHEEITTDSPLPRIERAELTKPWKHNRLNPSKLPGSSDDVFIGPQEVPLNVTAKIAQPQRTIDGSRMNFACGKNRYWRKQKAPQSSDGVLKIQNRFQHFNRAGEFIRNQFTHHV